MWSVLQQLLVNELSNNNDCKGAALVTEVSKRGTTVITHDTAINVEVPIKPPTYVR
jgi:hypothetical protein